MTSGIALLPFSLIFDPWWPLHLTCSISETAPHLTFVSRASALIWIIHWFKGRIGVICFFIFNSLLVLFRPEVIAILNKNVLSETLETSSLQESSDNCLNAHNLHGVFDPLLIALFELVLRSWRRQHALKLGILIASSDKSIRIWGHPMTLITLLQHIIGIITVGADLLLWLPRKIVQSIIYDLTSFISVAATIIASSEIRAHFI